MGKAEKALEQLDRAKEVAEGAERIEANMEQLAVKAEHGALDAELAVDVDGGSESKATSARKEAARAQTTFEDARRKVERKQAAVEILKQRHNEAVKSAQQTQDATNRAVERG